VKPQTGNKKVGQTLSNAEIAKYVHV